MPSHISSGRDSWKPARSQNAQEFLPLWWFIRAQALSGIAFPAHFLGSDGGKRINVGYAWSMIPIGSTYGLGSTRRARSHSLATKMELSTLLMIHLTQAPWPLYPSSRTISPSCQLTHMISYIRQMKETTIFSPKRGLILIATDGRIESTSYVVLEKTTQNVGFSLYILLLRIMTPWFSACASSQIVGHETMMKRPCGC